MKVGVLGFGRLGKLLVKNLAQDASVYVYDTTLNDDEVTSLGATPSSLEDICKSKILILCIPISALTVVAQQIKNLVDENTLVVDVCSVKVHPMEQLTNILPKSVQILGTHPMFGPDSAGETLFGTKIAVCPTRIDENYFKKTS